MKNLIGRLLVIGTALTGAVRVNAADKAITAYAPFYAGSTVMPRGAYRVDEVSRSGVVALKTDADNFVASSISSGIAAKVHDPRPRFPSFQQPQGKMTFAIPNLPPSRSLDWFPTGATIYSTAASAGDAAAAANRRRHRHV